MPHPELLQRVHERRARQHGEVGQAPARRVAGQQLRDAAVAASGLEQGRQVHPRQHEVELGARVTACEDLKDARTLAREAAADAGQGLRGRQRDAAVPRDGRGRGVERGGLALGFRAPAREDAAASAAAAASLSSAGAAGPFSNGEAGEIDSLLDLVLDVGRGDDLSVFNLRGGECEVVESSFFSFFVGKPSRGELLLSLSFFSSLLFLSLSLSLLFFLTAESTSQAMSILAAASASAAAPAAAVRAQ